MEETTPTLDQMEMESGSRRRRVSTLLLGGRPLDLQLSKHDITVILLRSIGPANVSSTVVNDIFEQIDEDKNGFITGEELSNFLQAKEHVRLSNFMMKRLVDVPSIAGSLFVCGSSLSILNNLWKRSREPLLLVSYIIMWFFLIGSALFAGDFVRTTIKRFKHEGVKSMARQLLRKNIVSLGQLPSIYRRTSAKIKQQEEMTQMIRDFIESKRRLSDENACVDAQENPRSTSTTSRRRSTLVQLVTRRSTVSESVIMHQMHAIVRDAEDTFSQEKLPKRSSTESLKTLDTESLTCPQDSRRKSDISLENGVRDTLPVRKSDFSLENSVRTDRSPSIGTTYASLSSTHKTIRVSMFVQSFAKGQIDTSSHEQSVDSHEHSHEQSVDKVNIHLKVCLEMARSTSVGIAVLYTVAGVLFTIGAIDTGLPGDVVQNMFLTGSCIYFSAGAFGLYLQWKARCSWRTMQSAVSALQRHTFSETTTQSPTEVLAAIDE
ncbi:hypothetical protein QTG54_003323 [Skeletonema marinoi]|uniref:EF-hand domain-containing protein n=1 Tax=Skeletonema marinoi TaxID=267567 RepID=A0AAD8YH34_9STRA|nr:hypothetical protein QTG54_003323 [Skeletonema marinoi]